MPSGLHLAHFAALLIWAGMVLVELGIEVAALKDETLRPAVAKLHHLVDLYVEGPALLAVVVTGTFLLLRVAAAGGADLALGLKIGLGLGAVGANVFCVRIVIQRGDLATAGAPIAELDPLSRWVFRSAYVGLPMGLAALWMGGQRVGWW